MSCLQIYWRNFWFFWWRNWSFLIKIKKGQRNEMPLERIHHIGKFTLVKHRGRGQMLEILSFGDKFEMLESYRGD